MGWAQPQIREHYIHRTTKELHNGYLVITYLHELGGGAWPYYEVINLINSGQHRFFTYDGATTAEIMVLPGTFGPFLKTVSDGIPTNNLEELPSL